MEVDQVPIGAVAPKKKKIATLWLINEQLCNRTIVLAHCIQETVERNWFDHVNLKSVKVIFSYKDNIWY
jgi:hypothetical protein